MERGGFWIVDDFLGTFEWSEFAAQMRKIFPYREIKDIPRDHPIFHVMYDTDHIIQTPSLAYVFNGGITWEVDGFEAECKGIWDDSGRLMVVINHNTDLGDAYEWSDDPRYPNKFSGYASWSRCISEERHYRAHWKALEPPTPLSTFYL